MAGSRRVSSSDGDRQAISKTTNFGDDYWRLMAKKARLDSSNMTEEEVRELQNSLMRYWFLLDSDLLGAISKGDLRWADVAMARVEFLLPTLDNHWIDKCIEGDEETLCQTHRKLMNEGWWNKACELDLRKTVWRREDDWERKMERQELELGKLIFDFKDLVHPNVLKAVKLGSKEDMRMALNHIHYNSLQEARTMKNLKKMADANKPREVNSSKKLESHREAGSQNFKNALLRSGAQIQKRQVQSRRNSLDGGTKISKQAGAHTTVFLHNLPEELNKLSIWKFIRKWGRVMDCHLPTMKDRLGKRYGFAKLQSESEAEDFRRNVNGKMLEGHIVRAQLAHPKNSFHSSRKEDSQLEGHSRGSKLNKQVEQDNQPGLGNNMQGDVKPTEILEQADVVPRVKLNSTNKALMADVSRSFIVQTWKVSSVVEVLNTIEVLGYADVLVRKLSSKKFLVTFPTLEHFLGVDQDLLGLGFLGCRAANLEDLIIPRKATVECRGLPVSLWDFENLSKIVESLGDLTAVSKLMDEELTFHNPKLEIETSEMDCILKRIKIEASGKFFPVTLKELEYAVIEENILEELIVSDSSTMGEEESCSPAEKVDSSCSDKGYKGYEILEETRFESDGNGERDRGRLEKTFNLQDGDANIQPAIVAKDVIPPDQDSHVQGITGSCKDLPSGQDLGTHVPNETLDMAALPSGQASQVYKSVGGVEDGLLGMENSNTVVMPSVQSGDVLVQYEGGVEASDHSNSRESNDFIWEVRDSEISSIASDSCDPILISVSCNASESKSIGGLSSHGSDMMLKDYMNRLKLGRKRGRPAKKKVKKSKQAFALKRLGCSSVCSIGASEAERIYESCILMGLEGQSNREEAIKNIASRLSGNQ